MRGRLALSVRASANGELDRKHRLLSGDLSFAMTEKRPAGSSVGRRSQCRESGVQCRVATVMPSSLKSSARARCAAVVNREGLAATAIRRISPSPAEFQRGFGHGLEQPRTYLIGDKEILCHVFPLLVGRL